MTRAQIGSMTPCPWNMAAAAILALAGCNGSDVDPIIGVWLLNVDTVSERVEFLPGGAIRTNSPISSGSWTPSGESGRYLLTVGNGGSAATYPACLNGDTLAIKGGQSTEYYGRASSDGSVAAIDPDTVCE